MRCELCSSGEREPMLSLCTPCLEAVARLWKIANGVTESCARKDDKVQAEARAKGAPIIVVTPNFGAL